MPKSPKTLKSRTQAEIRDEFFDVTDAMSLLAADIRAIEEHKAKAEMAIAKIETDTQTLTDAIKQRAIERAKKLYDHAHKRMQSEGPQKHVAIGTGEVAWALSPSAVKVEDPKEVVRWLVTQKFEDFLRRPEPQIDREAMLKDPERAKRVPGVSITQAEKAYVRPGNTRARVESTIGKKGRPGRWAIVWDEDKEAE